MSKIDIRYPDDTRKSFEEGLAAGEILASWKKDAVKDAVAARLNDRLIDLSSPVTENGTIDAVNVTRPRGSVSCVTASPMSWPRRCRSFSPT